MVLANLNTHTLTALYEAFEPQEARIAPSWSSTTPPSVLRAQPAVEFSSIGRYGESHFFWLSPLVPRFLSARPSPLDAHSQTLSAPSRLNGDTTAIDCHNCQIDCQAQREQRAFGKRVAYGRPNRIGPVSGASSET